MKQKKATAVTEPAGAPTLVHVGTQVSVNFGIIVGNDVQLLPPLTLTVSTLAPEAFVELGQKIEEQRLLKLAELNSAPSEG